MSAVWIGFAAFFGVSLAVGVRLLSLARRTRCAPELLIGLGVLGIGPVGFGLQALACVPAAHAFAEPLTATGAIAGALGLWAKLLFNWTVYRRASRFALVGMAGLCVAVAAHLLVQALRGSFFEASQDLALSAARGALQTLALGWGAAEAFVQWSLLRRRARLGLADPVVANRFGLWGVSASAAALGTAVGVVASLVLGRGPLVIPEIVASSSAFGMVSAIGMWLAFAPPRVYVAWIAAAGARA